MLPNMLGISDRVKDVLLVKKCANPTVCRLLFVRSVCQERFGECFESG